MKELHYRSIAVASTFSPRFLQVLAEARRIRDRFDSTLSLIYVGKRDAGTTKKFADALRQIRLPADSAIHYQEGEPATAILHAAGSSRTDLLVAGALEKEVVLRSFVGQVARQLVREADCSVMLFTEPAVNPRPFRKIVLMADFSPAGQRALAKTLHLAAREKCQRLYVVSVYTSFDEARSKTRSKTAETKTRARTLAEEEAALERYVLAAGHTDVPIETRVVRGNTAYAASDFVQSVEADLFVVPLPKPRADKKFPARFAWITDVIPCNLWVIR